MTDNPAAVLKVVGRALPYEGNDVDTDRIIPARFLRCVTFDGLGEQVFRDERYGDDGTPREHPFNDKRYEGASILVVNSNFGCGSSREHAPQAIMRYGIKAIIGESFAEIFAGNCTSLGIPVCTAAPAAVKQMQHQVQRDPHLDFSIDLEQKIITCGTEKVALEMNPSARTALLSGTWNTLDELLMNEEAIARLEASLPDFSSSE